MLAHARKGKQQDDIVCFMGSTDTVNLLIQKYTTLKSLMPDKFIDTFQKTTTPHQDQHALKVRTTHLVRVRSAWRLSTTDLWLLSL